MRTVQVPVALLERLGERGSTGLSEMFNANARACADDVLEKSAERFERRLVEETSKLRVDMADLRADLLGEIVSGRFELLKWAFIFWVGQVFAMVGVLSVMLRGR